MAKRATARIGLTAALVILGCDSLQNAIANGDTRAISLHHLHTGEDLAITYKRNGRYDDAALKKLNWILRDWRRNEDIAMDPRLIDLVWEVQRDVGASGAIQIVCGYRAPGTNEMLRKRSRHSGVARFSQHTLGKAMDFYIPGAALDDLRAAGLRLQRGGVGFYPTSGSPFVHLDIGNVRHWPRMTREQLVKVFPDGRTVHVPSDGQPLSGYALALADVEKRGGEPSATSLQAARAAGAATGEKHNLLAKLFGFGKDRDEQDDAETAATPAASAQPSAAVRTSSPPLRAKPVTVEVQKPAAVAAVPLPRERAAPVRVAQAQPARVPGPAARPAQAASIYATAATPQPAPSAAQTASIFESRGFWRGLPEPAHTEARGDSAAPAATGSIGPWPAPAEREKAPEAALAYAAPSAAKVVRQAPMGSAAVPRAAALAADANISIARKSGPALPPDIQAIATAQPAAPAASKSYSDDPWLRAMVLAPSIAGFTTTTQFGLPDMRALQPLMQQPADAVVMAFSDDPYSGMSAARFSGSAVVFVATASFASRTAALQ